jgi:uncharacterized membrane protein
MKPETNPPLGGIHRIGRIIGSRRRLFAGAALGVLTILLLPASFSATTRTITAWDAAVITYLALSALLFTTERSEHMEEDAEAQQEGEWTIFALTLAGVVFSFAAILVEFTGIKDMPPAQRSLHVILVALTLFLSWLMTHITFAFRYAHEFYARDNGGPDLDEGLDFPGEKRPDYFDFVYFSLVLGMTFQVSDVQITARKFRRMAAVHGLLSFLFNTIILALTVNLAAGLL